MMFWARAEQTAAMLEHRLPVIAFDDGDTKEECLFVMKEFEEQIFLLNEPHSLIDSSNM